MSITRALRLAPLLVAAVSCAGNPAPTGFLPSARDAVQDVYGGWIEVTVRVGDQERTLSGELLAARADTIWIVPDSGRVIAVATNAVKEGRLVRYSSDAGKVVGLSALGMISTVSNGYFLLLTAPAWIITGIVASSSESHAPISDAPPLAWADLAAYARFPQGLPPGIDLAKIRPKP